MKPSSRLITAATVTAVVLATLSQQAQALDAAQCAKAQRAAVRIRYERYEGNATITGHGTAFGVDLSRYGYAGQKYLLSAAHNVLDDNGSPFNTVKIELDDDARTVWSKCRVLAFDKDLDICLLESNDLLPALVELADADAEAGADVFLVGSPRGVPIKLFEGTLTKRFDSGSIRSMARIPFDHGDSGGPFFSSQSGKVIGVAVAGVPKDGDLDHNIGLFVPVAGVMSFLERHRGSAPVPAHAVALAARNVTPPSVPSAPTVQQAPAAEPVKPAEIKAIDPVAKTPAVQVQAPSAVALAAPTAKVETPVQPPAPSAPVVKANTPPVVEVVVAEEKAVLPVPKTEAKAKPAVPAVYVVQEGDNLTKIAKRFNVPLNDLVAANNIRNPNVIVVGTKLKLQ